LSRWQDLDEVRDQVRDKGASQVFIDRLIANIEELV